MYVTDRRASSNAAIGKKTKPKGAIAQLGERLPCTQEVGGSIPPSSTKLKRFGCLKKHRDCFSLVERPKIEARKGALEAC